MVHGLTGYVRHKCRCDICFSANSEYQKARYAKNREKMRAANKIAVAKWVAANPERHAEMQRASSKRYADKNRDKVRAKNREWREAHPEEAKAFTLAYHRANPQKARDAAKRRRVRLLGGEICIVTERDWLRLCRRYGNRCAYCGADDELHKDHVIPITRGGRHSIGNLLPCCKPCNSSKGTRLLTEWGGRRNDLPTSLLETS